MKKSLILVLIICLSMLTFSEWFIRGTFNNWDAQQMEYQGGSDWKATGCAFGTNSPRFKIDKLGNWAENYGDSNNDNIMEQNGADVIVTGGKTYTVEFNDQTKAYSVTEENGGPIDESWDSAYLRGTMNSWGALAMDEITPGNWKKTGVAFGTGDANGGPRFKVDQFGNWQDNYGDGNTDGVLDKLSNNDIIVQSNKTYTVEFNDASMAYTLTIEDNGPDPEPWDEAYISGTLNSWGTTSLTEISSHNWKITDILFDSGDSNPRFVIDRYGNGSELYGDEDNNGALEISSDEIEVTKDHTYDLEFNDETLAYTLTDKGGPIDNSWDNAYFRGTANNWQAGNMVETSISNWEITTTFGSGDGNGGPRFKICKDTNWQEHYGDGDNNGTLDTMSNNDISVAAGAEVKITFNDETMDYNVEILSIPETPANHTMMQYFEWYIADDYQHWNNTASNAADLAANGVTAVWLPPMYKAEMANSNDRVGYGTYDLFDLGEFAQKTPGGGTATKYGTKAELEAAIKALHQSGVKVYGDVVLNHKAGADAYETVYATKVKKTNRYENWNSYNINSWTVFNFDGRGNNYSSFKWNKDHFDGVNWNQITDTTGEGGDSADFLFRFANKGWESAVDGENVNYDYLMHADIDFENGDVVNELKYWGSWFTNKVDTYDFGSGAVTVQKWSDDPEVYLDGYRIDAVKHIDNQFFGPWLDHVRATTGDNDMFAVGEYWKDDLGTLEGYLNSVGNKMSLFDVPLQSKLKNIQNGNGGGDMASMNYGTLTASRSSNSVTIVNNHDVQKDQALENPITGWMRPIGYAFILLQDKGVPCVFYGDYYGIPKDGDSGDKAAIDALMKARRDYAYGDQNSYFDNGDVVGLVRKGDASHPKALALVMNDQDGEKWKEMWTGKPNTTFDIYWGRSAGQTVTTDGDGKGNFPCNGKYFSVWVSR